jgi:ubiquinone/menaquinone biosynthesis C-methylase UbiE
VAPPAPQRDPMLPKVPDSHFSAFWASGRVPTRANTFLEMAAKASALGKERSFQILNLHEGSTVLDVGCGNGRDVARLMELVGPTGEVWGVDNSAALIAEAKAAHPRGLFVEGDVNRLPFQDNFFDAVRAERVLMHLVDPFHAFSEMLRVTKPGGMVLTMDADTENYYIHPCDPIVFQRFITYTSRRILKHARLGLELYDALVAQGAAPQVELTAALPMDAEMIRADIASGAPISAYAFFNPPARMHAVQGGAITQEESDTLARDIQRGLDANTILFLQNQIIVAVQKPG